MSIQKAIERMADSLSNTVPVPEREYIGEDGLHHCCKCNDVTEKEIDLFGVKKKVRCICTCRRNELEERIRKEKEEERERKRNICFSERNMKNWTFENDNRMNERISDAMKRYADHFQEFRSDGRGLLLHGSVGTGKTFFAACIANELINNDYSVIMTNFARLTNEIQSKFSDRQAYIDDLNRYSLLIIDDLGMERTSEYMQEIVYSVIDARYRSGLPMIITTNLSMDTLKKPSGIGYSRIYDRILEKCFPIEISGNSMRKQKLKESFFDTKEKLGL